jgi:ketosteroid isomerase-like protein
MHRTRHLGFALVSLAACSPDALDAPAAPEGAALLGAGEATAERAEGLSCGDVATAAQYALHFADRALARATERHGVEGLLAGFDDDALYLTDRRPVLRGKDAIRAELLARPPGGTLRWVASRVEVGALPDVGYTTDQEQITSGADTTYGKHVAFWRLGPKGWRVAAWLTNPSDGPPATPPDWFTPFPEHGRACPELVDPDRAARQMLATDAAFADASVSQGVSLAFYSNRTQRFLDVPVGADFRYRENPPVAPAPAPPGPGDFLLEWTPLYAGAGRSGDLGFTVGESVATFPDETGATVVSRGKYLTIWQKQADGSYKYFIDGGNDLP